jgi:glutaredoxin 3
MVHKESAMPAITIYTTTYCPYCVRAKDLLNKKGATFSEINAEDDAVREAMVIRAGGRRTVPQIFIGDFHVGGCDDLYALDKAGKLDPLLSAAA